MKDVKMCGWCKNMFAPLNPRRLYCSKKCAEEKQAEQLKALGERRRRSGEQRMKPCAVCTVPFEAYSGRALYCGEDCRKKGLALAIERQKERRKKPVAV